MSLYSTILDVASALAPPRTCPGCRSERMAPVSGEGGVTFTCLDCHRIWSFELGLLAPAGPRRPSAFAHGQLRQTGAAPSQQRDAT